MLLITFKIAQGVSTPRNKMAVRVKNRRKNDFERHILKQGSHRLEKYMYLNLEGFLEESLKIKSALKSTGKPL